MTFLGLGRLDEDEQQQTGAAPAGERGGAVLGAISSDVGKTREAGDETGNAGS